MCPSTTRLSPSSHNRVKLRLLSAISPRVWSNAWCLQRRKWLLPQAPEPNQWVRPGRNEPVEGGGQVMNAKRSFASIRWSVAGAILALLLVASTPNVLSQRDRGFNQPGAAGNGGGRDPGVNQPGAVGNVGRGPGFNQPGAVGNYGGSARQTRVVGDPGFNQPGRVGNR